MCYYRVVPFCSRKKSPKGDMSNVGGYVFLTLLVATAIALCVTLIVESTTRSPVIQVVEVPGGIGCSRIFRTYFGSGIGATSVAIDPRGNEALYVTSHTSLLYNGPTNVINTVLNNSGGVFATCTDVWVADTGHNRVVRYARPTHTPTCVYGQVSSDTLFEPNAGMASPSLMSLNGPRGVFVDAQSTLYVADTGNNRVLKFLNGTNIPSLVWGDVSGTSGCSSALLSGPTHVYVDTDYNVYITDSGNHRVLKYDPDTTVPTHVYGQDSFESCPLTHPPTIETLRFPMSVAGVDGRGILIADSGNARVLYVPDIGPTEILMQSGNFTNCAANSDGDLYCVDASDGSVVLFTLCFKEGLDNFCMPFSNETFEIPPFVPPSRPIPSITAMRVYGQLDYVSSTFNPVTADSLYYPRDVHVDELNEVVYITDTFNNRVLVYNGFGNTTAARVYGQNNMFTTRSYYGVSITMGSLSFPRNTINTPDGVYILDTNRLLFYPGIATLPTFIYGQAAENKILSNGGAGMATDMAFAGPEDFCVDMLGRIYVADTYNHRVLVFQRGSNIPTHALGQTSSPGCSQTTLYTPSGIHVDAYFNVYVADTANNRVLRYPPNSNVPNAVYGQPDFTTCTPGELHNPVSVNLVEGMGLFVTDQYHHRVLLYQSPGVILQVYGQSGNFMGTTANQPMGVPTAENLNYPYHCNGVLYCADTYNNRVLVY